MSQLPRDPIMAIWTDLEAMADWNEDISFVVANYWKLLTLAKK